MPAPTRHIIQQQTVWLDQPDSQSTFQLQERVSAYCRNQLPGVLEGLFDQVAGADTVVRLDKVDVNVGTLSLAHLEEQLTRTIVAQLTAELTQLVQHGSSGNTTIERYTRAGMQARQFRFFLENGYLPTWANTQDFSQFDAWLQTPESAFFRPELIALLADQPSLVGRLIHHVSDDALGTVSQPVSDVLQSGELTLLVASISQSFTHLPRPTVRERYWRSVFEAMGTYPSEPVLRRFYRSLLSSKDGIPITFFQALHRAIEQGTSTFSTNRQQAVLTPLKQLLTDSDTTALSTEKQTDGSLDSRARTPEQTESTDAQRTGNKFDSQTTDNTDNDLTQPDVTIQPTSDLRGQTDFTETPVRSEARKAELPTHTDQPTVSRKADTDEPLFVGLAGIVLLHPFLPTLFAEMKLVENRQWVSVEAAVRGVQTLAYMATAAEFCPEYDMPLLKLLCGLPFEQVVPPDCPLNDAEKQLTLDVLDAVIGHWSALGTASPAGLREAFLQRQGKLAPADGGWRLTVERKTLDLLIDKLPWGVSIVKLPWMSDLLFVDWT